MRPLARHLPAFLILFVPLGLLAWLGSRELSRLEVRADRLSDERAQAVLAEAGHRLQGHVEDRGEQILGDLPDLALLRLVHATQTLREHEADVLDLCIVDSDGHLVFPRVSPDALDGLPFHWTSPAAEVRRAEVLESFGDLDGARSELERFISARDGRGRHRIGREDVVVRARFVLARVQRARGDLDAAADQLRRVVIDTAPRPALQRDVSRAQRTDAAVAVLAELALVQLDAGRGRGLRRATTLMRDIAAGVHDAVADSLLREVLGLLDEMVPADSPHRASADLALQTDLVRREGRGFADEYRAFVWQSIARKIRHTDAKAHVLHAHNGPEGASLLVLRPLTDTERERSLEFVGDAGWIGVRLDLDPALLAAFERGPNAEPTGFRLVATDADGVPIGPSAEGEEPRAALTTVAGIQLAAIEVDSGAVVAERERSNRVRALLLFALCLTAAAGALLLVRSVAREAEFAAARMRFVSQVSHELRTPLALIRMYGETLALGRATDGEQATRFAKIITREADHLAALVNRVLDLAHAGEGRVPRRTVRCDLGELLRRVAADYRPHLTAEHTRLNLEVADGIAADVDAAELESAVVALLENALKYGPTDDTRRRIDLSLARHDSEVRIEVADRGIGIPSAEHGKVFEGFYRASNSAGRRGAGLGLDLVRRAALRHGGSAEALPREGGGTIVRISLPIREERTADAEDEHPGDRRRSRSA